jgi:hypothetical protein
MRTREMLTLIAHKVAVKYAKSRKMRKDLCGLCMIVSSALYKSMRNHDEKYGTSYNPKIVFGRYCGSCHCWVESDGIVYDATYQQFEGKPVHIGKRTIWHNTFKKVIVGDNTFRFVIPTQKPTVRKVKNFVKRMEEA